MALRGSCRNRRESPLCPSAWTCVTLGKGLHLSELNTCSSVLRVCEELMQGCPGVGGDGLAQALAGSRGLTQGGPYTLLALWVPKG